MKLFIALFLFIPFLTEAAPDAVGIIVKVKDRKNVSELDKLALKVGLTKGYTSTHLNYLQYKFKNQKVDAAALCEKFKTQPNVELCEVDKKLVPNEVICENETEGIVATMENIVQAVPRCKLYAEVPGAPVNPTGATPLWAQEYTGADLVREHLQRNGPLARNPEELIDVWDTDEAFHGEAVATLIASPSPVGIIPTTENLTVNNFLSTVAYIETHDRYLSQSGALPRYINNSFTWSDSDAIPDVVSEISRQGMVFVTAAGNDGFVEVSKNKSDMASQIIIVASNRPNGLPSGFSQFGPSIDISAPSDNSILAMKNGAPALFGGTSGAAPLVTGALAAFTLISDYDLSVSEAKNLLRKTAIKLPQSYIEPSINGVGNLNAYKISQIAQRIKELCSRESQALRKQNCLRRELANERNFNFPLEDLNSVKSTFPACFSMPSRGLGPSCQSKKESLIRLRKEALLHPENPNLWKAIACVYRQENYPTNASYYDSVANSVSKEGALEDLGQYLMSTKFDIHEDATLAVTFVESNPAFLLEMLDKGHNSAVNSILYKAGNQFLNSPQRVFDILDHSRHKNTDEMIFEIIKSRPNWVQHPEVISRMITEGNVDILDIESMLSRPHWATQPQLARLLVETAMARIPNIRRSMIAFLNLDHWKNVPELQELRISLESNTR